MIVAMQENATEEQIDAVIEVMVGERGRRSPHHGCDADHSGRGGTDRGAGYYQI